MRVAIMTVFHLRSTGDFRGLSMPQASYATINRSQREVVVLADVSPAGKTKECR